MAETKTCDACGQSVTYTGHRGFGPAHQNCPKRGTNAADETHPACPTHGTLVWVVGPYSTFRSCENRYCTSGKRGKPYRFCAPRGEYAGADDDQRIKAPPSDDYREEQMESNENEEQVKPKSTPQTTTSGTLTLGSLGPLGQAIQEYVDARAEELASEMIAKALADAKAGGPSCVEWQINSQPFACIEGTHHKALPRLLKLYAAGFRNFLVVGPAGSGKTTLARDLVGALNAARKEREESELIFGSVSCTAGMSESALTGRAIPDLTTGKVVFQSTEFVACYERGGVFLLDEVDAADPNVMLVINAALANGHMPLPNRTDDPAATRHADTAIICAANTWGTGADRQYVGRNQLDAAFLDRFVGATVEVDYDRDLESALVGDAHICARVWGVRDRVRELKLRRVVGTRFLQSVTRLVKGAGESLDAALTACTVGWTADERSKVGIRAEAN